MVIKRITPILICFKACKSRKIGRIAIFASVFAMLVLQFFANIVRQVVPIYTRDSFNEAVDSNALYPPVDDALFTRIWNRRQNTHAAYVRERVAQHSKINFTTTASKKAYDYFEPEWNCEDEVRLGSTIVSSGDGQNLCAVWVSLHRRRVVSFTQ
jgi:hypothetical protein